MRALVPRTALRRSVARIDSIADCREVGRSSRELLPGLGPLEREPHVIPCERWRRPPRHGTLRSPVARQIPKIGELPVNTTGDVCVSGLNWRWKSIDQLGSHSVRLGYSTMVRRKSAST